MSERLKDHESLSVEQGEERMKSFFRILGTDLTPRFVPTSSLFSTRQLQSINYSGGFYFTASKMAVGPPTRTATAFPSVIAFGSQTTWPSSEYLFQLRAALLLEPRLRTFLIAIKELPRLWQDLIAHDPRLTAVPGQAWLDDLVEWVNHGELQSTSGFPPNVLTMPFTIIIHITQYFHYLDGLQANHAEVLENVKTGGIQGFCTGILSAISVACSTDEEHINVLGIVALKLALCIGAYVDLDGAFATEVNETTSVAVRWRSEAGHDSVLETLKSYPEVSMAHMGW